MEENQRRKQTQSVEARKNFEFKIDVVKKTYEEEREDQRRKLLERQKITYSKRERVEMEKRMMLDERRNKSEVRGVEIRKALVFDY